MWAMLATIAHWWASAATSSENQRSTPPGAAPVITARELTIMSREMWSRYAVELARRTASASGRYGPAGSYHAAGSLP